MTPASSSHRLEPLRHVDAGVLDVAYYEAGPTDGPVVVLLHGFPYDIHSYVDVAPDLAAQGCRTIVPYLRGYGPTRFRDKATPRSGEQAALGVDLIALIGALGIQRAVFAGYDWGGRAACVGAALWPARCAGLVSLNSYNIQDIAKAMVPASAEREVALWYQYYFQLERGRAGLAEGDPHYADVQRRLAAQPAISVPAITLDGAGDGVFPANDGTATAKKFSGPRSHRVIPRAGHNLPQEEPEAFAAAVMELIKA